MSGWEGKKFLNIISELIGGGLKKRSLSVTFIFDSSLIKAISFFYDFLYKYSKNSSAFFSKKMNGFDFDERKKNFFFFKICKVFGINTKILY